jgi:periplasmic divalent cation tolerance protein
MADAAGMNDDFLLVLTTCPDAAVAERLAVTLVEAGLAGCVNILPGVTSVYRWQGRLEKAGECLLAIKTRAERYAELEGCIKLNHPYELAEVIAVPIAAGSPDYLAWIKSLTCAF